MSVLKGFKSVPLNFTFKILVFSGFQGFGWGACAPAEVVLSFLLECIQRPLRVVKGNMAKFKKLQLRVHHFDFYLLIFDFWGPW